MTTVEKRLGTDRMKTTSHRLIDRIIHPHFTQYTRSCIMYRRSSPNHGRGWKSLGGSDDRPTYLTVAGKTVRAHVLP